MVSSESLRTRYLPDADARRLYSMNTEIKASPSDYCPTCQTKGFYQWQGTRTECDCELQLQLLKHYLNAGIGRQYMTMSWDDFHGDEQLSALVSRYLDSHDRLIPRGMGIMLCGDVGRGKSMALNLLLKDLVKLHYSCFATSFTTLIELFTAGWYSPEEKNFFQHKIKGSQVLLIDDVGKEMKTKIKLPESTFDDVLRYRVNHARPTFITSNMSPREMLHGYGAAILSLVTEVSLIHELFGTGEDFRPHVQRRHLDEIDAGDIRPIF